MRKYLKQGAKSPIYKLHIYIYTHAVLTKHFTRKTYTSPFMQLSNQPIMWQQYPAASVNAHIKQQNLIPVSWTTAWLWEYGFAGSEDLVSHRRMADWLQPSLMSVRFCWGCRWSAHNLASKARIHGLNLPPVPGPSCCWWCDGVGKVLLTHSAPLLLINRDSRPQSDGNSQ